MSTTSEEFLKSFDDLITKSERVLLSAHMSPDDDSISSVLGMKWYLEFKYPNKLFDIVYPGKATNRWQYFEGYDQIKFVDDVGDSINDYDTLILFDVSSYSRVIKDTQKIKGFKGNSICIDHHKNQPDSFTIDYVDTNNPACSFLLFELFYNGIENIPARICEVILLGILGDTGSFTYIQPSQAYVLSCAQRLITEGNISIQALKARYMQYDIEVFKIMQILMSNFKIMEIGEWGKFSITFIDRAECSLITTNDLAVSAACHIFVDTYSKSIKGVNWGMVYYPKFEIDEFAASFRSLPQGVNVRVIAQAMNIGGGHDLASGGKFPNAVKAEECILKVTAWLNINNPTKYI